MIIDRKHISWGFLTAMATIAAGTLYVANFHPKLLPVEIVLPPFFGEVPPRHGSVGSSPLGIIYGLLAFGIFLFASLLGARKKKPLWKIGHPRVWLRAHIWLTIFSIPLILFHCGFKSGSSMTTLLVIVYGVVMVSGFFGLALQQFMPSLMRKTLDQEVVFEQIPYIRTLLLESARKLRETLAKEVKPAPTPTPATPAAEASAAGATAAAVVSPPTSTAPELDLQILIDFFDHDVLPYLAARNGAKMALGRQQASDDYFRLIKLGVPASYANSIDELQGWCDDRRRMDLQSVMHHWLHGWLLIHVPISILLLLLTVWHIVTALRFV